MFSNQRHDRRSRFLVTGMAMITSLFAGGAAAMTDEADRAEPPRVERDRVADSGPVFDRDGPPGPVLVRGEEGRNDDSRNLTVPDRGPVGRAPVHGDTIS